MSPDSDKTASDKLGAIQCHAFFSSVLADVGLWIRFLRKEAMYPRAPSLDATHQFTLSQATLWLVVPGVAKRGCSVPCSQDEPESCR